MSQAVVACGPVGAWRFVAWQVRRQVVLRASPDFDDDDDGDDDGGGDDDDTGCSSYDTACGCCSNGDDDDTGAAATNDLFGALPSRRSASSGKAFPTCSSSELKIYLS